MITVTPPENHRVSLVQPYFQGCTIVFNKALYKHVVLRQMNQLYAHDALIGVLAAFFGTVLHDERSYILYRQHGGNTCGGISHPPFKLFLLHLKHLIIRKKNANYSRELYDNYFDLLKPEDQKLVLQFVTFKKSWKSKVALLANRELCRPTFYGTFCLKFNILFNRFDD